MINWDGKDQDTLAIDQEIFTDEDKLKKNFWKILFVIKTPAVEMENRSNFGSISLRCGKNGNIG